MTRRIAILLTSNDDSDFAKRFPNDGEKFIALLKPNRPDWHWETVSVKDNQFPDHIDDFDGYITTGSPASVHDGEDWMVRLERLIVELNAVKKPLIGVCFGHQIIAKALGGTVSKNPQGWEIGTSETRFTEPQDWMVPAQETLTLYAAHKEQVSKLPDGARTIGTTPGCPISAFAIDDHIMTTEFHPEMQRDFMTELLDEMGGALTPKQRARALADYEAGQEGVIFGRWMIAFLENAIA